MATRQKVKERARRERAEREQAAQAAERRRRLRGYAAAGLLGLAAIAALVAVAVSGDGGSGSGGAAREELREAGHVHGLGAGPGGRLFIATHTGLFLSAPGQTTAESVGTSDQDIMGFTVAAGGRFLGSGHPGSEQSNLPANLGLIESRDGGRTWKPISLLGEADFHVLRASGERVYGFDSTNLRFLVSSDAGRRWDEREVPEPLVDLAIDPADPDRLVASGESGLLTSGDAGRQWRALGGEPALLAWSDDGRLYSITGDGAVEASADGGRSFAEAGTVSGQPVAFMADGEDLYVALADGGVQRSTDGGRSWVMRARL
jgi:hypothetical protein